MPLALGATWTARYTTYDSTGTLADAGAVTVTVTLPDGTTSPATVVHSGTGTYDASFAPTLAGRHTVRPVATGANSSALPSDAFNVMDSADAPITSLADAKSWLNIAAPDWDDLILRSMNRATEVAEAWTGKTIRQTSLTEVHTGWCRAIRLRHKPVISITSVTENGVTLNAATDYTLDPVAPLLWRGPSAAAGMLWARGLTAVSVTYLAGYVIIPDKYLGAVEELTRTIFSAIQNSGGDADDAVDPQHPTLRRVCAQTLGPRIGTLA